jgi:hypothetical protein
MMVRVLTAPNQQPGAHVNNANEACTVIRLEGLNACRARAHPPLVQGSLLMNVHWRMEM